MLQRRTLLAVMMLVLAVAGSGCIFSPKDTPPVVEPPDTLPFPSTPDTLMANFKTAYSSMKIDDYRDVLHPQYQFLLRAEDIPVGGSDRFTYAEELQVAENMFSGEPISNPNTGVTAPGISSITIETLTRNQPWSAVGVSDPDFPGTERSLYEIKLSFSRAGYNTIIVTGQQEFFVSYRDSLVSGVTRRFYQLRGQRDLSVSGP